MKTIVKLRIAVQVWLEGLSWSDAWAYAKAVVEAWRLP